MKCTDLEYFETQIYRIFGNKELQGSSSPTTHLSSESFSLIRQTLMEHLLSYEPGPALEV